MPSPQLYGWKWDAFQGSALALKWARRDLPNLDRVVTRVPQKRVAVQAGGNLGMYPKRLAALFDTVYCFEPSAALFPLLVANAPESNIVRFQAALGSDPLLVGTVQERRGEKTGPAHEGVTHIIPDGHIPVLRLDDFVLPVCDLLQLDIEGWEGYALTGAAETIQRCRPVLCIEVNGNQDYEGAGADGLRDQIIDCGYRFVERLESDEVYVPEEWA